MTKHSDLPLLVARILLGLIFLIAGLGKLDNIDGFAGYMASGGLPAALAWPVIVFEIVGGIALIAGLATRPVALMLGIFSVVSGMLYHFDPSDQMQMTMLLKNLAMAGGYVLLAITGPGRYALDRLLGAPTPAAA